MHKSCEFFFVCVFLQSVHHSILGCVRCEYNFVNFFFLKRKVTGLSHHLLNYECSLINGIHVVDSPHLYRHNYLFERDFPATPTEQCSYPMC